MEAHAGFGQTNSVLLADPLVDLDPSDRLFNPGNL